jgi:LuxR family maltose regulon positive regulatory protein
MARLDPAIRHQITPPNFSEGMLHRERLVDRLHGELPRKLVVIAAPAGYGKTSLLADFVHHTELPVAWFQLANADRDFMRLASGVVSALEQRFRRLRDKLDLRAFAGSSPAELANAINQLIGEEVTESFVLVLDDVHKVQDSADAVSFLDRFILGLPDQGVVFASGREVIEISLARMMAHGELAGFGPQDLALSREEIGSLYGIAAGKSPPAEKIEQLYEQTRGWVTGVVLSEFSIRGPGITASIPEELVYEYLGSVVLNRQPERIRRFLLETSVLPVMTAPTCDLILGRDDSKSLLEGIVAKGLFTTSSGTDPTIYEYHPMFRALLMETFEATAPSEFNGVRENAARVLSEENPEAAIDLFLAAGDQSSAAEVVERVADRFFETGRYVTLEQWRSSFREPAKQIPSLMLHLAGREKERGRNEESILILEQVLANRRLSTYQRIVGLEFKATCLLRLGEFKDAAKVLAQARDRLPEESDQVLVGRILRAEAMLAMLEEKDLERAEDLLDRAVECFRNADEQYLLMASCQDLAMVVGMAGNLAKARDATGEALELGRDLGSPNALSATLNNLAQIDYLEGRFEEALRGFSEARSLASQAENYVREAAICFGQAELFTDLRMSLQAAEVCEVGLEVASKAEDPVWLAYGCMCSAILHRRAGGYRLANEWLRRGSDLGQGALSTQLQIQSAAIVSNSDPGRSVGVLRQVVNEQPETLDAQQEALCWYFLSAAHLREQNEAEARRCYRECLDVVNLRQGIQFIAPELALDPEFKEWAERTFEHDPVHGMIQRRIEIMSAVQERYEEPGEPEPESGIIVQALAEARITFGGKTIDDLKPLAMEVFFLLVEKGSAERDLLADIFWPDHPVGRQTANLHMAIYNIRSSLGKGIVRLDGSVYRLGKEARIRYDVADFERAVEVVRRLPPGDPRRIFALTEAVNLYRGRFLPEFFSDWVGTKRRELEFLYLEVAADHAEEALLRDQPRRALASLRAALKIDPFRDDLNEAYIKTLARLGRRSEVVIHYRKYSELLRAEFGLEPTDAIRDLYERVSGGT